MQTEPASSGPADTPEPQPPFDLVLLDAGHNMISVIKEVRGISELGLKEAKELCESGGVVLKDVPDLDLIKPVAGQLTALGATVEVRPSEGAAVDIGPVADGGPTGMPAIVCRGCQERGGVHQGRERQWRDKTKKGLFFGSGVIKSEVEYWCSRCGYSWSEELGSRFGGLLG